MVKTINNLNTLNALIRDERMASSEYAQLSNGKNVPPLMRKMLREMSNDEARHKRNLENYKSKYLGR